MSNSRATIYSNGIADFQRVFPVSGRKNVISIPVRQQHLADVLASLTISGDVVISAPPSFQPANQDETSLRIPTSDSITSFARQLAGADVELTIGEQSVTGKLFGVQDQQVGGEGEPFVEQKLVVHTDTGLTQISIRQIEKLQFTDPAIRTEIDKALSRQLRQIKPNSTFIELELSTKRKKTDAIIQYTIPAAAWKISYRIITGTDSSMELQGHAIVDNNTDEDWQDFVISVVMGQPITFSTDLAESKTPARSHVNVVQDEAVGSVEVEETIADLEMLSSGVAAHYDRAAAAPRRASAAASAKLNWSDARERAGSASIQAAEVSDTGDFCIFESANPVSIDARRSASIPMFQTVLDESKSVLHFRASHHPERPYQSIRFKNSTEHSLGRGACTVYDRTTYVGNCIVPTIAPGGIALLPHALETAVRVHIEPGKVETRRIGIRVAEGVAYESYHKLLRQEYVINSKRDQALPFLIDHQLTIANANVNCQLIRPHVDAVDLDLEKLKDARRVEFELLEKDVVKVVFIETAVSKSVVRLTGDTAEDADFRIAWLYENLIDSNSSLAQDPAIARCMELQKQLDETIQKLKYAHAEIKRLNERQERLRKNIQAGVSDQQKARWQDDLSRAEDNLVQLEEEHIPDLMADRDDCRQRLFTALHHLVIDWSE